MNSFRWRTSSYLTLLIPIPLLLLSVGCLEYSLQTSATLCDNEGLAQTHEEKVLAIANISFPNREDNTRPVIPTQTPGATKFRGVCPQGLHQIIATTRNNSPPGNDGLGYMAIRLWNRLDSDGLCDIINTLIRDGLPKELKTAKVVVILKPGKRDMDNPKSYRCISLLNNIAKLTEKAVAQYLTLEGETIYLFIYSISFNEGETTGWWHEGQFRSCRGRNTTDALMWLKNEVAKNRKNRQNTAVIMTDIVTAFPGTQPSTVLQTLAPLVGPVIYR
jgi:hypothetical protein